MSTGVGWWLPAAAMIAEPMQSATVRFDLPAGTLGATLDLLSRRTGASVVLTDPALWSRPVPRLHGQHTVDEAMRIFARAAGVVATKIGVLSWRITPHPPRPWRSPRPASVRDPAPSETADIVVLGSKRGADENRLPMTVERLTDLSGGTVAGTEAIVRQSAVVSSTYRGAGREKLFVRGIADSAYAGQSPSVTGLYFGDLRLGYNAVDPGLELHDLQSVEVLQGPQGTLYGSGSIAGVVRLNPRLPVADRVVAEAGLGGALTARGAPGADADAMLNLPLGGGVTIRGVGYARQHGGFVDKPDIGRDVDRVRTAGGRVIVRWQAARHWTVDVIGMGQTIRARDSQYGSGQPYFNPDSLREPFESRYAAAHLVVSGRIGGADLASSTGVAKQLLNERFDARASFSAMGLIDAHRNDRTLLHETRLSRRGADGAGWVAGLSHVRNSSRLVQRIDTRETADRRDNRIAETALYGEAMVRAVPKLLLGGGGRVVLAAQSGRAELPAGSVTPHRRQAWWLPAMSATYEAAPRMTLFARYQRGIRAGNLIVGQGDAAERTPPDRLDAVELGTRYRNEGAIAASASLMHATWRDIQTDYVEGGASRYTENLGNGHIASLNLTLAWVVSDGWTLTGAATINHSRLARPRSMQGLSPGVASSMAANPARMIPNVAATIGHLAVRHDGRIGADLDVSIEGWGRYEGKTAAAIGRTKMGVQGDYALFGLTAMFRRRQTALTLDVDNLLNDSSTRFLLGSPVLVGAQRPTALRPLTGRIGLRWHY